MHQLEKFEKFVLSKDFQNVYLYEAVTFYFKEERKLSVRAAFRRINCCA